MEIQGLFQDLLKRGQKSSAKFVGGQTSPKGATSYITWGKPVPKEGGGKSTLWHPPEINPFQKFNISIILHVSTVEGCPLSRLPLYTTQTVIKGLKTSLGSISP